MIASHLHAWADSVPVVDCRFLPRGTPGTRGCAFWDMAKRTSRPFARRCSSQERPSTQNLLRNLLLDVPVEIRDAIANRTRSHKEVQAFLEHQHPSCAAGHLVGKVLAQRSLPGDRVILFADVREKQETDAVGRPRRKHD